ncbi:MAG: hypothetical protein WAO02_01740 [Verrucomicrobiia bacterium]
MISKREKDQPGTGQVWKSVVPGLQYQATQASGVKTLFENCWLIPAEENGMLFFDHAITVADNAKLRCQICLLRTPHDGFAPGPPNATLNHPAGAAVRIFQKVIRSAFALLARRDTGC